MLQRQPLVLLCCLSMLFATACRTMKMADIPSTPIVTPSGRISQDDVRKVIVRCGERLGWTFNEVEPGHLIATLNIRVHTLVLDIRYSASSYDIQYKDSKNLMYDGKRIHRKYFVWIRNLQEHIKRELANY